MLITHYIDHLVDWVVLVTKLCSTDILSHIHRCAICTEQKFFVQAIGFGIAAWTLLSYTTLAMRTVTGVFGIAAALCCVVAGIYAIRGYRTHPLFFCPGALFFACFLFCRYQQWSAEPELQRYVFQLAAAVVSMFALYQRSALGVNMGSSRQYVLWSRSAVLLCLAAIPGSQLPLLWLCLAISFALDRCEEVAQ